MQTPPAGGGDANDPGRPRIRILLVDDHTVLRAGTRRILEDEPDLSVVGEAGDGQEAIALAQSTQPDVIVLDISMPNLDGVGASSHLLRVVPGVRLLILTGVSTPAYVRAFQRMGASGYLLKSSAPSELIAAIRLVHSGAYAYDLSLMDRAMTSGPLVPEPTRREIEVLRELASGHTYQEIAASLGIANNTVEFHVRHIYDKLGVTSRSDAIRSAQSHGWLDSE
jgi:DNA-binding NarL/FixJ family response regulator